MNHPIQPIEAAEGDRPRFKKNLIVDFMVEKFGLNNLAIMDFPQEDWEQLAQLIGYSLSGFSELSYVRDETYDTACKMLDGATEDRARIEVLEEMLERVREGLKIATPAAFRLHPDDLHL